jgi:hydrophobic/amphiphilic exporter-1 (mainly G- bacteria), HAE1 family
MKIVEFSIRRPVTVTMLFVAIAVFGVVSYDQLALNLLPEISYPTLTIRTEYEAAAPAEVEKLISQPIENAVGVVENVVRVSSVSKPEVSDVILEFGWNTQMDFAGLEVREKLDLINLPLDADDPILLRYDPSTDPIMRVSVTGSEQLATVRYLCEEFIRPEVESIAGVAAVNVSGGLEDEIYIELNEQKIANLQLSITSITNALSQENINVTGGTLREGEAKYLVRTINEFQTVEEINEIIVALKNGAPVRLGDVGSAFRGYKEREIITRINGEESVQIAVFKAADANTVSVAATVREKLSALEKSYEGRKEPLKFDVVFDQSGFIKQSVDEVLNTALIGGILAVIILFIFLRSIKSTLIISLSIPLSVVATFFLMYSSDVSLNIMSLSGLALGIGMLVDNSIVVLESIYRYTKLGYGPREAANRGASEVGHAVIASTMTTICVFAPIVFVEGIAGQLFADQAMTVTFSLGASLLVAIMLIPMMASLGDKEELKHIDDESPVESRIEALPFYVKPYIWFLSKVLKARIIAVGVALALFAGSMYMIKDLGSELIPEISQGEFLIDYELPPGTALEETSKRLVSAEKYLAETPEISSYYTIVGSGNQTGVSAVEEREYIGQTLAVLQPGILHEAEAEVMEKVRSKIKAVPAVKFNFSRPTLFSFKTPIEIELQGYNINGLKIHAQRIKDAIIDIPGLRDVKASTEGGNPEVHIVFNRLKLSSYGLNISAVANMVRNKVQGEIPTEFREGDRNIDIRVRVREQDRRSIEDLKELTLDLSSGGVIRLNSVAEITLEEGPVEIRRIGPQRAAVITANISGRDLSSVVTDIETAIERLQLPSDFVAFVGGQNQEREVAFDSMQFAIILAIFLVYLVMASQFESLIQPFIIMFAIPFALIGVAGSLIITGQTINVVVLIGVVVLAGIVVNNSIVLIDYTNQLRRTGQDKFTAVKNACAVRIRPILMTTATTVLGLSPMALSWGEGAELRVPLAITVIGGLIVSTLLTLLFVPVLYTIISRETQK